jgi:hypothetical protein
MHALAVRQQFRHECRNRDGTARSVTIHAGYRARWDEYAQLLLETVNLVERPHRGRDEAAVRRSERDLEPAGHGAAMDADQGTARRFSASLRACAKELTAIGQRSLVEAMPGHG